MFVYINYSGLLTIASGISTHIEVSILTVVLLFIKII